MPAVRGDGADISYINNTKNHTEKGKLTVGFSLSPLEKVAQPLPQVGCPLMPADNFKACRHYHYEPAGQPTAGPPARLGQHAEKAAGLFPAHAFSFPYPMASSRPPVIVIN